jgi:outer membrane protein OmpA-like peptidoglycan-associated protein
MKRLFILFLLLSNCLFSQKEISHDVYFDTDKYAVPLTEENRLLLFISSLDSLPIEKISIYGFCDDRGTNDYNLKLSQQRANTIKALFSEYGINDSLITNVNGKGEILLKVLKENEIHKIRGLNRKVEINVALKSPKPKEEKHIKKEEPIAVKKDSAVSVSKEKTSSDIEKGNIKKGDKIRLENIYFKTSYSSVLPKSKKTLENLAKILVEKERVYFTIQGHVCCTQNSRDAIDKKTGKRNLSVARAKSIYNYFAKKGVSKRRMKYVGMRRKFPLGGDPELDRRVEILITYVGKD